MFDADLSLQYSNENTIVCMQECVLVFQKQEGQLILIYASCSQIHSETNWRLKCGNVFLTLPSSDFRKVFSFTKLTR